MTTNSWDSLRPKLAPNPQQHRAGPIMLGAMAATTMGAALMVGSLILLFGITEVPTGFAGLRSAAAWRLILGVACLYVSWSLISNGNNFFEYERFRRETAKSLPAALPAYAGRREIRSTVRGLIVFSEGWKAAFVPVRAYSPFHNSLRIALLFTAWPALRRLGYPPRGVLRWAPNILQYPAPPSSTAARN